ncbi:lmo0937 family membrane protein, partial [Taibaiella helva]|uniref:lmo0937 family membrane protein n=1 Tax=Taibaiella helva TaxID=2301235 RepID=UPI000E58FC31
NNLLYTLAVALIIVWGIIFFGYHAGSIIHILLLIAAIIVLLSIIREGRKPPAQKA